MSSVMPTLDLVPFYHKIFCILQDLHQRAQTYTRWSLIFQDYEHYLAGSPSNAGALF